MKITIKYEPISHDFNCDLELPEFEYGCRIRSHIARHHIRTRPELWSVVRHAPEDYIVELVDKTPEGEVWHLGS